MRALGFHRAKDCVWVALVVVLFCLPMYVGLGDRDYENDEAGHAFSVDLMLADGDWLTPKSAPSLTEPFLEKPPLKFWIVAAPIRLGLLENNEFGQRFWDPLFGAVAFLYVFFIGRMLGGPLGGFVSVLLLFTHRPLLLAHGLRGNNMESVLVLAYCGGVYHFLRWRIADGWRRRGGHLAAVALYFVAAFMCKFVAAIFLPFVLVCAVLLRRDDRRRLLEDWRLVAGVVLMALALIAPWFLYEWARWGAEFWRTIFGTHVYQRFTTYLDPDHLKPWSYYVATLAGELRASGALTITLAGAALLLARAVARRSAEAAALLLWLVLPLAVISLGSSKIYHYAYAFLPPVGLAGGYAAAVLFGHMRALANRWTGPADAAARTAAHRIVSDRRFRLALTIVGAAAVAVGVATYLAEGRLHVRLGGITVLRNSGILRPLAIAVVALGLAGRLVTAVRGFVPLLVLLLVLPIATWQDQYSRFRNEEHPVRSIRDCLQPIAVAHASDDPRGPGVYIEDEVAAHTFQYYLRDLGRWFQRGGGSDPTVYTALYAPGTMKPVLLSTARDRQYSQAVARGDRRLLEQAARKAGMTVDGLTAAASAVPVTRVTFPGDVLLLPGPYSPCGIDAVGR